MTIDERLYDRRRLRQFLDGRARAEGIDRRALLRLLAAGGALGAAGAGL
ncbi:sulfite oxidase, partial [Streptomyces triticirhizae]